jgi:hypothetical protein
LLDKTTDNGCTEEEALSAMMKARTMMEQHGISEADLRIDMSNMGETNKPADKKFGQSIGYWLATSLGHYCDVKPYVRGGKGTLGDSIGCYGAEPDRVLFGYLLDYLTSYIDRAATTYAKGNIRKLIELGMKPDQRALIEGYHTFVMGAVARVTERLRQEVEARNQHKLSDGRALVVIKQQIVQGWLKDQGIHFGKARGGSMKGGGDYAAFAAGQRAGDAASFNRQVGGTFTGTRQIGN